ncbi:hypothetical protein DIPPA_27229 [Diplonema papillatum]|nr:hypothetical protein DIPPA_27229 [Diplonema papillatum]
MSVVDSLAQKYGFSPQAVQHLAVAVQSGNGACAQFNHPGLGGMGQWARGGMLMIGDAFNHGLKHRVSASTRGTFQRAHARHNASGER